MAGLPETTRNAASKEHRICSVFAKRCAPISSHYPPCCAASKCPKWNQALSEYQPRLGPARATNARWGPRVVLIFSNPDTQWRKKFHDVQPPGPTALITDPPQGSQERDDHFLRFLKRWIHINMHLLKCSCSIVSVD